MTKNETIDLQIINRTNFLLGQIELYKIKFAETNDNNYLEVMNELNKSIILIDFLKENSLSIMKEVVKLRKENKEYESRKS